MYFTHRLNRVFKTPALWAPLVLALLVFLIVLFQYDKKKQHQHLNRILQNGKLSILTRNNAHCYYDYRGEKMGFEYDLAKAFADYLGVRLSVQVVHDWNRMIPALIAQEGDLIAASLAVTPERQKTISFSKPYLSIQQHIIVHRKNRDVKNITDLSNKTIWVRKGTSYEENLLELKSNGYTIDLKTTDNLSTESLIRMVAEEEIEITVADHNIALLNQRYYPQIKVGGSISQSQYLAWALPPQSYGLQKKTNHFFAEIRENGQLNEIYNRYYRDLQDFDFVDIRAFHQRIETRLPRYQKLFENICAQYNFDWRLIAAQAYQESHLNPKAQSHAGAYGIMQLTKTTAKSLGVTRIWDPEQNIQAGVRHLAYLYQLFDKAHGEDRQHIAFAAYNIGQGHIYDARQLARKKGLDPNKWDSLEVTLPLLMQKKYYQKAKYGYCRGIEPIRYIRQILMYHDILKHKTLEFDPTPENFDPALTITPHT
ncbi:membrane-bound lytic murein transglycosylase MltF [Desulfobacterales bacterium HSG17]|nr:membrane-bound lytic murein transglycosylase MltF [Desulfobacterales bacterium HSG17]